MGGSGSSANPPVTQVESIIKTSVTNVVQKIFMEKSIAVKQSALGMQTTENIRFTTPRAEFCPADQMKSTVVIRQATKGEQTVALTLDKLNAAEIAGAIGDDLQRILLNTAVNDTKLGIQFNQNPNANQYNSFDSTTVKNIQQAVESVLNTYVDQEQQYGQTMRMINIEQCGNVEITQDIQANMLATDMANAIAKLAGTIAPQVTAVVPTTETPKPTAVDPQTPPPKVEPQTLLSTVPVAVWIVLGVLALLLMLVLMKSLVRR